MWNLLYRRVISVHRGFVIKIFFGNAEDLYDKVLIIIRFHIDYQLLLRTSSSTIEGKYSLRRHKHERGAYQFRVKTTFLNGN